LRDHLDVKPGSSVAFEPIAASLDRASALTKTSLRPAAVVFAPALPAGEEREPGSGRLR
jgi:hypothetical protein